jgi:hypothetical protein
VSRALLILAGFSLATAAGAAERPPYLVRGDVVEARYNQYRAALAAAHGKLAGLVAAAAPDLVPALEKATREPAPAGYQVLPRIVEDLPLRTDPRPVTNRYSWPRCEALITRELSRIAVLEETLAMIVAQADRRPALTDLVAGHDSLYAAQRSIASHIEYNRLWQADIASRPAHYARANALLAKIRERAATADALRREALEGEIRGALEHYERPAYVGVMKHANEWVIRVPVYTDIADAGAVSALVEIIESGWRLDDGADHYRVTLEVRPLSARQLYRACRGDGSGCGTPRGGELIDLAAHAARFPQDGAILTTGGRTLHVKLGRAIVLGPQDLHPRSLVHEFGHLLGFADLYVRGYRNLGADGYEVIETEAEHGDIMGDSRAGPVLPRHFEQIVRKPGAAP